MFKRLLIFIGKLFGFTWYDSVDVRCPKCGKRAIVTSDVIQNEACDQITQEKFDRFVYSINCPRCGCSGALTEIWEQEVPKDNEIKPIKLVVHKSDSEESNKEMRRRLKEDREGIIEEIKEQMLEMGATEKEIEKMIEDLNKQLDMLEQEELKKEQQEQDDDLD